VMMPVTSRDAFAAGPSAHAYGERLT